MKRGPLLVSITFVVAILLTPSNFPIVSKTGFITTGYALEYPEIIASASPTFTIIDAK